MKNVNSSENVKPTEATVKNNKTATCSYYVVYVGWGMDAVAMDAIRGTHYRYVKKSFYGRLSGIRNNFVRGKLWP